MASRSLILLLVLGASIASAGLAEASGYEKTMTTTQTFVANQIQLSGAASYYASCPAPEPSTAGPCVKIFSGGRAYVEYEVPNVGDDPAAGGDYWEVRLRFTSNPSQTCYAKTTNADGDTLDDRYGYCSSRPRYTGGMISSGRHRTEIRCWNDIPNNGCALVLYEIAIEVGFWALVVDFTEEQSPNRLCVTANVYGFSDWYGHLDADINWGDGTIESRDDDRRSWCHDYSLSLVPYVVDIVLTDGLGQRVAYHTTTDGGVGLPSDQEAFCRTFGSWGSPQYHVCMGFVDPTDPICGGGNPWNYEECRWVTTDPVGWTTMFVGSITDQVPGLVQWTKDNVNRWLAIFGLGPI